jgi:predicted Zn-dependent peptidase
MMSKSKLLLLVSILFCASVIAQDIQSFQINGLKVILKQNTASEIISAKLFYKGGVTILTEDQAGLENLTLLVAQKATKNYPKEKLNAELESMNSQIGSTAILDYSSLNLLCVQQNFYKSWNIFSDIILNPLFSEEDLNLERDKVIANVKQVNDNPDAYLQKLATQEFYIDHPYAVSANGTEATLNSFTTNDLSDFHSQRLKTSDMLLVVVGNVSKSDLEKKVNDSFGNLDKGSFLPEIPTEVTHAEPSIKIVKKELPTNYIQGTYSAPSRGTKDGYTMLIMNSILRDRVWNEVRTKRSLSYAPSAFYRANFSNYGAIYVSAVEPDTTMKVMIAELQKLKSEPISENELNNKIRQFITFYYLGNETNQAQASNLAFYELSGVGYSESKNFLDHIKKIIPQDIQNVAQKYIKNLQFVMIGNPTKLEVSTFMY